jgi:hypothetical protein
MTSPVVVDGFIGEEKLAELRKLAAEYPELDFKSTVDLSDARSRLNFVLDAVAMLNTAVGGYLIIGLNDDGSPAHDQAPVRPEKFDSADLAQLVGKYVSVAPVIVSKNHVVEKRDVILIHVFPTTSGLPAFISLRGEYKDAKERLHIVLQEGAIYTRSGTRNVAANDTHWPVLLERYREQVMGDSLKQGDALMRAFMDTLGEGNQSASAPLPPLLLRMSDDTFAQSVIQHLQTESPSLSSFLNTAIKSAWFVLGGDLRERRNALNKVAVVAILAMQHDRVEVFEQVMGLLHRMYSRAGNIDSFSANLSRRKDTDLAAFWLDVLLRLFLVGAAAVRAQRWWAVTSVSQRSVQIGDDEMYPSWLRHGLVYASRAELLSGGQSAGGVILSMARELGRATPALRPDLGLVPPQGEWNAGGEDDVLLDSIIRFDAAWCCVLAASNLTARVGYAFYPSCAAFRQERSQPMFTTIASRWDVRNELAPDLTDEQFADGIEQVVNTAQSQSFQFETNWTGLRNDPVMGGFVAENRSE